MRSIALCLALSSCVLLRAPEDGMALSPSKQKQKIIVLEKKLNRAQHEQRKAVEEVDRLTIAVHEAQLALIQQQIDKKKAHYSPEELPAALAKEREILEQIAYSGPSPAAFEARRLLDELM